ncbi:TPA: DUF11 domain-containing protein [Candidatus Saccharibacteria bacterium]|nr:DUF11 domain-containing protein [Candidatus Saccharibacteria bacterium]HIO87677.1 DUF11 domain-containing protein [Candidatus Saccharibacteria bacterium]
MFKKIVSNLPYSPSLLSQVGFYIQRLKKENITRKLGLIFAGLTLVVQFLVVVVSPVPSIASDANDLIRGGLRTAGGQDLSESAAKDALTSAVYGANATPGLQELFEFYGISREDIASSRETYICSKEEPSATRGCNNPDDRNLRSIGRDRNTRDPSADVRFTVPGRSESYYHRPLHIWDSSSTQASKYKALSIDGGRIYVLYSCGNIVFREPPETNITTDKRIVSPSGPVEPGDILNFQLSVANNGNSPAYNVKLVDRLNPNLRPLTPITEGGTPLEHNQDQVKVEWIIGTLGPNEQAIRNLRVYVIEDAEGEIICNRSDAHYIDQAGASDTEHSEPVACVDLEIPPEVVTSTPIHRPEREPDPEPEPQQPEPENVPESEPEPEPICLYLAAQSASSEFTIPVSITFKPTFEEYSLTPVRFKYFVDNEVVQDSPDQNLTWSFEDVDTYQVAVQIRFSDGTVTNKSDCSLEITTIEAPNERIDQSKSARLLASFNPIRTVAGDPRSDSLHQQTVGADEIIEYRLTVQNSGNVEYEDYTLPNEYVSDVLEYADVISGSGERVSEPEAYNSEISLLGGGKLNDGVITWSSEDKLEPGETIEKLFFVQIKNPIPETNQVASNPLRYDCQIDNTYSNTISIKIDCPVEKQVEQTIQGLPNTGAGQSFSLLVLVVGVSVFLYQRNKLLSTELSIIKQHEINGV